MLTRLHDRLFGGIEKIDIHCQGLNNSHHLRSTLESRYKLAHNAIPVHVTADAKDMNFALVHYSTGLFRPAHADVVVIC
jgi:hypothetical protein